MTIQELVREVPELEEYLRNMPPGWKNDIRFVCILREPLFIRRILSWIISVLWQRESTG